MALKLSTSTPFANRKAMVKGLVAGSLMVSAMLNDYWMGWRFMLFAGGLLVFIEALMPYDKELHTGTVVLLTIIGGVISVLMTAFGGIVSYTVLIVTVCLALYGYSYAKSKGKTWF
jgi:hypothetical protein